MGEKRKPLHIVSWNVAGWKPTVNAISMRFGSVEKWLDRLKVDIFCIQEAKISRDKLELQPNEWGAKLEGWESFWSTCNSVEKKGLKGYAGVTTFARKGLTEGASARVFNSDLDREGRLLMTDHGRFVIFNIYAPTNGVTYSRLTFKLRFLTKLRERMQEQRLRGKEVMLVGDFNISYRAEDVASHRRLVNVRKLFAQDNPLDLDSNLHKLLRYYQDKFFSCMDKIEVVPHVPARKQVKKKEEMFKVVVQMDETNAVEITERCNMPEVLEKRCRLKEISVDGNIVKAEDFLSLGVIKDIMGKCLEQKLIGKYTGSLSKVSTSSSPPPLREWMVALIQEDAMVDSYASFFLDSSVKYLGRFTCWDQSRNQRYRNSGSRIDFILVDKKLFADAVTTIRPLDGGKSGKVKANSWAAALVAATANFGWQAIPYQGERIDASQRVYEVHLGEPSTGLIYTPPTWSDHIATQFLLDARPSKNLVLRTDKETKYAQPQKTLRSITSFFGAKRISTKEKCDEVGSDTGIVVTKATRQTKPSGNSMVTTTSAAKVSTKVDIGAKSELACKVKNASSFPAVPAVEIKPQKPTSQSSNMNTKRKRGTNHTSSATGKRRKTASKFQTHKKKTRKLPKNVRAITSFFKIVNNQG